MGDNGDYPKGQYDLRVRDYESLAAQLAATRVVDQPTATPQRPAASMLHEAARIVAGDRNETHGAAERSFAAIANLWNAYLFGSKDGDLTPVDVAHMMVLLKMARAANGKPIRDHAVDMCGYAALAGELACDE